MDILSLIALSKKNSTLSFESNIIPALMRMSLDAELSSHGINFHPTPTTLWQHSLIFEMQNELMVNNSLTTILSRKINNGELFKAI